ncbi:hypothetical protein BG015_002819 [Linnemannia schmuckeri]|uniref:Cyclin-domain-containing protein n=1 Tax=Linnemannia schmuckeri TaxID=64567 RepID=A0A9P5RPX8_9FUNG|nr:hypothetical protein BG015_002819 [Linnemannia schmuckeri]
MGPSTTSTSSTASPLSSKKHQQQQSISQLADFAAHMVCYLLYGHQPAKPTHHHHHNAAGTPPSSIPSSPLPGQGSHNSAACLCEVCSSHSSEAYSPLRSTASSGNSQYSSSWSHYLPPPSSSSLSSPLDRPTHRRIPSESDIVQPKPMFRKFCLDVLSATLLSPSVILLSLKYIQQLMINLKESNKIVNTGEGAEYRFFTGALILANKFLDDNTFTNKTWADITGMKIKDVNHLEMQFLSGIEFRLFTSSWQYSEWLAKLTQFTGTYMPSQHEVAYQQQTAAAQSPISPMDPNTTVAAAAAAAEVSSGSGPGQDQGHSAVSGSNSSIHPYAVVPTSSLSMASISHYIDSVKHIQHKSNSTNSRFQRVPASTYHHSTQLAPNPTTVPSHQHQHQHQYQNQQQQPHYSSLPPSGSFTSSPSSLPYAYQPRLAETIHRKRSANIAFEDIVDRSPRYEPGLLPQPTSQQQLSGGSTISRHKRFSSSSSVATLMGSLSTGPDTFHSGHSPMNQQPQRYQQQQRPLSSLPQRASSGALSHSFRTSGGHHHQRSASGGNFYVDMPSAGSSPYGHESSSSHVVLSMPPNPRTSGVHPLDEDHHDHQGYYTPSKGSYMPPQQPQQQPQQQQQQQQRHRNHRHSHSHSHSHSHFHSTVSPSYSPNGYESPCHSMGCSGNINRNTQGGSTTYEIDPRLWGPLDSLSLYAITTQAAKRVVAQGKALSSSANGLHMYYPTTLA